MNKTLEVPVSMRSAVANASVVDSTLPVDNWAHLILDSCRCHDFVPDARLCFGDVNNAISKRREQQQQTPPFSGECASDASSSTSFSALDLTRMEPTSPTTTERPFSLPPELMASAYRLDALCLHHPASCDHEMNSLHADTDSSSTAVPRLSHRQCALNPVCVAGLQSMSATPHAVKDCLNFVMGGLLEDAVMSPFGQEGAVDGGRTVAHSSDANSPCGSPGSCLCASSPIEDAGCIEFDATMTMPLPDSPCLWRGLMNLGNTCYLSSILMLLYSIPAVRQAVLGSDRTGFAGHLSDVHLHEISSGSDSNLKKSFLGLAHKTTVEGLEEGGDNVCRRPPQASSTSVAIACALEGAGSELTLLESSLPEVFAQITFSLNPRGADSTFFANYLSLDINVQQDAQEFFTLLIDWLRCQCGTRLRAVIDETFSGIILYDRKCRSCGSSTKRSENFLYLSLPLRSTLFESLDEFAKEEEVEGFVCEACGKTVVASSRQYLRTLPDVLVLHLNRFEFDQRTLQRHKLLSSVSFPSVLDMTLYAQQWSVNKAQEQDRVSKLPTAREPVLERETSAGPAVSKKTPRGCSPKSNDDCPGSPFQRPSPPYMYELRGVLNHLGDSAFSGHYTYDGKVSKEPPHASLSPAAACWLGFNDAKVSREHRYKSTGLASRDAYMLTYYRIHTPNVGTKAAAEVASSPTTTTDADAPSSSELSEFLLSYVKRINDGFLQQRRASMLRRSMIKETLELWATAARAIFNPSPEVTPLASKTLDWYCIPTSWLELFGRCFLGQYANVELFGKGGGTDPAAPHGQTAPADSASTATFADMTQASGNTPIAVSEPIPAVIKSGEFSDSDRTANGMILLHAVQSYPLQPHLSRLLCPHGLIAPWADYKVLPHKTFALVMDFLLRCGVLARESPGISTGNLTDGTSLYSFASLPTVACYEKLSPAFATTEGKILNVPGSSLKTQPADTSAIDMLSLASNCCAVCAAAMASAVVQLPHTMRQDCIAMESVREDSTSPVLHSTLTGTVDATDGQQGQHQPSKNDHGRLVFVNRAVAELWRAYVKLKQTLRDAVYSGGYTSMFALMHQRMPTRCYRSDPIEYRARSALQVMLASLLLPLVDQRGCRTSSIGSEKKEVATREENSISYRDSGNSSSDGGDMRVSLLCPHGSMRLDAVVQVVSESTRQHWILRTGEMLLECCVLTSIHVPREVLLLFSSAFIGRHFLPLLPFGTTLRCEKCTEHTNQRQIVLQKRAEEFKDFPTLRAAVVQGGATAAMAPMSTTRGLAATVDPDLHVSGAHPNRLFFKKDLSHEYREHVADWRSAQDERIKRQEAKVRHLRKKAERHKEMCSSWKAMTRRGGRRATRNATSCNPKRIPESGTDGVNPDSSVEQLITAERKLQALKEEAPTVQDRAYGCLPMWWVVRWYRQRRRYEDPSLSSAADVEADEGSLRMTPRHFEPFLCLHNKTCMAVNWLNPSDGFWQGVYLKQPAMLWCRMASNSGINDKGFDVSKLGLTQEDMDASSWLPPLLVVPMSEYAEVLRRYGMPDMLEVSAAGNTANAAKTILIYERNGERVLAPPPCERCCRELVEGFKDMSDYFHNGKLNLQLHIRKSKKLFYDGGGVLQFSAGNVGEGGTGIQYYTTLGELRGIIREYIAKKHGWEVPADELNILRGRKPLRLKRSLTERRQGGGSEGVVPECAPGIVSNGTSRYTDAMVSDLTSNSGNGMGIVSPLNDNCAEKVPKASDSASLECATLYELGIHNGDTLCVNLLTSIATPCAKEGVSYGEENNNQYTIDDNPMLADADLKFSAESTATFANTRLQKSNGRGGVAVEASGTLTSPHSAPAAAGSVFTEAVTKGITCPVCTFSNAEGMVFCEMCEAPLPLKR